MPNPLTAAKPAAHRRAASAGRPTAAPPLGPLGTLREPSTRAAALLLAAICLLVYANSFGVGFALDNRIILLQDSRLRGFNYPNLYHIFTRNYWWPKWESDLYRPLTTLSYLLNFSLGASATNPAPLHAVNLALHFANALLAMLIFRRITGMAWPAIFTAAAFAAHPLATESVTSVVGRADLLATLFVLLGLWLHMRLRDNPEQPAWAASRGLTGVGLLLTRLATAAMALYAVHQLHGLDADAMAGWPWLNRGFVDTLFVTTGAALIVTLLLGLATRVAAGFTAVLAAVVFFREGDWLWLASLAAPALLVAFGGGAIGVRSRLGAAYLLLCLGSIVGVFCKESAIVLIGVIGLYDMCFTVPKGSAAKPRLVHWADWWQGLRRGGWVSYAAVLPSVALLLMGRYWLLHSSPVFAQTGCDNPVAVVDPATRIATAIGVVGDYFCLLLWPATLSADYSYNQIPVFGGLLSGNARDLWTIAWLVIVPALLAWVLWRGRRDRTLLFFAGVFCGTFLPVSNVLFPVGTILGERLMYLPSVGFLAAMVVVLLPWVRRLASKLAWPQPRATAALAACAAVVIGALGVRAFIRNFDWQDNVSLWSAAVRSAPNSHKVYSGLASALWERDGQRADLQEMTRLLEKATFILEGSRHQLPLAHMPGKVYDDLAMTLMIQGDRASQAAGHTPPAPNPAGQPWYSRAFTASQRAVQIDAAVNEASRVHRLSRGFRREEIPDVGNYTLHLTRGDVLLRLGMNDEAIAAFNYARRLEPSRIDTHARFAIAAAQLGRIEDAAIALIQCLMLDSSNKEVWTMTTKVYASLTPGVPALLDTGGAPMLNAQNPLVPRHLALAMTQLVRLMMEAQRPDDARTLAKMATDRFGHEPTMYEPILKQKQ